MKTKLILLLFFFFLLYPLTFRSTAFAQVAPNAGRITSFSPPVKAHRGATISLNGQNFNHKRNGKLWKGSPPPYRVQFIRMGGGIAFFLAEPTFVSATELKVTIPATAPTGSFSVMLAEAVPGGVGGLYGKAPNPFRIVP